MSLTNEQCVAITQWAHETNAFVGMPKAVIDDEQITGAPYKDDETGELRLTREDFNSLLEWANLQWGIRNYVKDRKAVMDDL